MKYKVEKKCAKGLNCGFSCISKAKTCRQSLAVTAGRVADTAANVVQSVKNQISSPETDSLEKDKSMLASWYPAQAETISSGGGNISITKGNDGQSMGVSKYNKVVIENYGYNSTAYNYSGLREGTLKPESREKRMIDHLNHSLSKLRSVDEGTKLHRGISVDRPTYNALMGTYEKLAKSKKPLVEKAFTSTTRDKDTAEVFSRNSSKLSVSYVITTKSGGMGKDIQNISKLDEKEVLFMTNASFRVDKADPKTGQVFLTEI